MHHFERDETQFPAGRDGAPGEQRTRRHHRFQQWERDGQTSFRSLADYSEWKNNRRATGIIFATICFALKAGLSIGSASLLWLLGMYGYHANQPQTAQTLEGIRLCSFHELAARVA